MPPPTSRRGFVSRFVLGAAGSFLAGAPWRSQVLGSILPGPAGVLKVKISDFPALQSVGGSVQLTFSQSTPSPLMINRGPSNTFYALDSDCQHQHCTVAPYNSS